MLCWRAIGTSGSNLTCSVGRLRVNLFLIMNNGLGFMNISDIQVIMNSSILSKAVIELII